MSDVLESIEMIYEEGERCGYYLDCVDFKYTIEYDHDGVPEPHHELLQPQELCQKLMRSNEHILDCVADIENLLPFKLDSLNPNNSTMISDRYAGIESSCNSAVEDGSVKAKTDDNSNISDCVAPIEESVPIDRNSLKPNNPTMTSDDNAEIENSSNSAVEDGSVNAKTDDNSNISDCVAPIEESVPIDRNALKPNNPTMTSDEEADLVKNETTSEEKFDVDIHLKQDVLLEMNSPASNTDSLLKTLNSLTHVKYDRFVAILKVLEGSGTTMKRMDIISSAKDLANMYEFCDETWIKDFYTLRDNGSIEAYTIDSTIRKGRFLLKNEYRSLVKSLKFKVSKKRKEHKPEK
jgi:hypothetical protein